MTNTQSVRNARAFRIQTLNTWVAAFKAERAAAKAFRATAPGEQRPVRVRANIILYYTAAADCEAAEYHTK